MSQVFYSEKLKLNYTRNGDEFVFSDNVHYNHKEIALLNEKKLNDDALKNIHDLKFVFEGVLIK